MNTRSASAGRPDRQAWPKPPAGCARPRSSPCGGCGGSFPARHPTRSPFLSAPRARVGKRNSQSRPDVDDGLLASQPEGGHHRVGFLPGGPIGRSRKAMYWAVSSNGRRWAGSTPCLRRGQSMEGEMDRAPPPAVRWRRRLRQSLEQCCYGYGVRAANPGCGAVSIPVRACDSKNPTDQHAQIAGAPHCVRTGAL